MKRFFRLVNKIEELFVGYALLTIAIIATIQVILRYTTGIAYDWVDEGSRYMTVLITFMGAGICVRYGTHFSMDAIVQYSPRRIKHLLKLIVHLISAAIMLVAFYYSWVQIGKLHRFGATTPSLGLPMYIPYLPIGVFTLAIALRFLGQAYINGKGLIYNLPFKSDTSEEED